MADAVLVVLDRPCKGKKKTQCTVHLHGATVVSWIVSDQEQLFVSKYANFDGVKPIRGGVPIVFPHFGPWEAGPQHGFARTTRWGLEKSPRILDNGDVEASFVLFDNEATRAIWNFPFRFSYNLVLTERELRFFITIQNCGTEAFEFNVLMHNYFKVPDVSKCTISGLDFCDYVDQVLKQNEKERNELVVVDNHVDRIYRETSNEHIITNVMSGLKIKITKENLPDTVVWNPWVTVAKGMEDMAVEECPFMVCVEAGNVATPQTLNPGETYEASQIFELMCIQGCV